jgi:crossover junction endodeoxyribonuclease RuvC
MRDLLARTAPQAAAIEGIFYCKNVRTAVVLGEARGVVIAACAAAGVPVFEYEPRRMKQAIVGFGGATKEQVARMVVRLLGLRKEPPGDAADGLGLAICHLHSRGRITALEAKPL